MNETTNRPARVPVSGNVRVRSSGSHEHGGTGQCRRCSAAIASLFTGRYFSPHGALPRLRQQTWIFVRAFCLDHGGTQSRQWHCGALRRQSGQWTAPWGSLSRMRKMGSAYAPTTWT